MDFEINFIFLVKSFLDTTEKLKQKFKTKIQNKNSKQKFENVENEKSFLDEIKSILHHFQGLSVAKVFPCEYC